MKLSISLSLFILALGVLLGWRARQQREIAQGHHAQLIAKAAQSGISLDSVHRRGGTRIAKRERVIREVSGKRLAADFLATAKETAALRRRTGMPDEAAQQKNIDLMANVTLLDPVQLKILITELLAVSMDLKDLKDGTREELRDVLVGIANDHPQVALALFAESENMLKESGFGKQVIYTSLIKWALQDPMAATEWVGQNGGKFPDWIDQQTKFRMISDASVHHPELALQVISGLGLELDEGALCLVGDAPKNAEERTATLTVISAQLASLPAGKVRDKMSSDLLNGLMRNALQDGFDAGTKWLDNAGLTPEQLACLANGNFSHVVRPGETGKWIEWMDKTIAAGKADTDIRSMISSWTMQDYKAAGKWLASTPEGFSKNASISAFAETVAQYDPETAAQWAVTLPPGENRGKTLKMIYRNWPNGSEVAKEAFAEIHGLK